MAITYLKIPVFCLTVLGSERHKQMHEHLVEVTAGSQCHFEFVAGQCGEDIPFHGAMEAAISSAVFDKKNAPTQSGLAQLRRAMNVKAGMMVMMQRIIDLRCPWALAIQDDVRLLPDWRERCVYAINAIGASTDRIAMTCIPKDNTATEVSLLTKSYCTETASLVTPSFCHRYIAANKLTPTESDIAIKEIEGECVASFNIPAAYLRCTGSSIAKL